MSMCSLVKYRQISNRTPKQFFCIQDRLDLFQAKGLWMLIFYFYFRTSCTQNMKLEHADIHKHQVACSDPPCKG